LSVPSGNIDRLPEPIRLGRHFRRSRRPFTTIMELVDFAEAECDRRDEFGPLWREVKHTLRKAVDDEDRETLVSGVRAFRGVLRKRRWLME
jgi:hypothetical protein